MCQSAQRLPSLGYSRLPLCRSGCFAVFQRLYARSVHARRLAAGKLTSSFCPLFPEPDYIIAPVGLGTTNLKLTLRKKGYFYAALSYSLPPPAHHSAHATSRLGPPIPGRAVGASAAPHAQNNTRTSLFSLQLMTRTMSAVQISGYFKCPACLPSLAGGASWVCTEAWRRW